jgi:anti-sigma factor RsiW
MLSPSDAVTCARCEERLEDWLDGTLDPVEAAGVEDHVRRCPSCADSAALARDVLDDLRDLPELEPPSSILDGVRAATGRPVRFVPWARHPAVLAAAAVLVMGLSAMLLPRSTRPTSTDQIEQATVEARYALGVVARAGRAAGREVGDSLAHGLPVRETAAEIGYVLDRVRSSDPEILDVHGG